MKLNRLIVSLLLLSLWLSVADAGNFMPNGPYVMWVDEGDETDVSENEEADAPDDVEVNRINISEIDEAQTQTIVSLPIVESVLPGSGQVLDLGGDQECFYENEFVLFPQKEIFTIDSLYEFIKKFKDSLIENSYIKLFLKDKLYKTIQNYHISISFAPPWNQRDLSIVNLYKIILLALVFEDNQQRRYQYILGLKEKPKDQFLQNIYTQLTKDFKNVIEFDSFIEFISQINEELAQIYVSLADNIELYSENDLPLAVKRAIKKLCHLSKVQNIRHPNVSIGCGVSTCFSGVKTVEDYLKSLFKDELESFVGKMSLICKKNKFDFAERISFCFLLLNNMKINDCYNFYYVPYFNKEGFFKIMCDASEWSEIKGGFLSYHNILKSFFYEYFGQNVEKSKGLRSFVENVLNKIEKNPDDFRHELHDLIDFYETFFDLFTYDEACYAYFVMRGLLDQSLLVYMDENLSSADNSILQLYRKMTYGNDYIKFLDAYVYQMPYVYQKAIHGKFSEQNKVFIEPLELAFLIEKINGFCQKLMHKHKHCPSTDYEYPYDTYVNFKKFEALYANIQMLVSNGSACYRPQYTGLNCGVRELPVGLNDDKHVGNFGHIVEHFDPNDAHYYNSQLKPFSSEMKRFEQKPCDEISFFRKYPGKWITDKPVDNCYRREEAFNVYNKGYGDKDPSRGSKIYYQDSVG
ncbi:MAG: hypothetical protein Q8S31_06200 [Alphaproteobacteria bacterium]|nr:hypothetical protein [Alphaproteobacteria bacterium]